MSLVREYISIVIPCYNEAENIIKIHSKLTTIFSTIPAYDYEIIFVDDGSNDATPLVLLELSKSDTKHVRALELSRNFGKEAALTAGIDHANGDAVIPLDADMQDPPELIPALIAEWQNGFDVVLAKRSNRDKDSLLKRQTARFFYSIHNGISDLKIPSNVGDFRLLSRKVADTIRKLPERQRFMKGLFAWAGFKTTAIEYQRTSRDLGSTKFSGWSLWNLALEGITSFSTAPLRIWTYIGATIAFLTLAYGLFIIANTLIYGTDVPGYASMLVAVLFLGGLQLIGIGVLGEYIGRIYMESKQRPSYVISKKYGEWYES